MISSNKNQEKVWDSIAPRWAEFRTRPVEEVVEFLKDKGGKVLDLGCGSGRNFIGGGLVFYGVDFSEKFLEIAKKKSYVELKKGTTDKIPYGDRLFDFVVFVRVLHCVEGKGKRQETLREIFRVLKNGGEAVISTIGIKNQRVKNKPKEGILPWTVGNKKYERYNYIYDKNEIEKQLINTGFKIISTEEKENIVAIVKKPL
jgi:ubiquinone/menaquinone biosynthesis C-methylase UbiE